MFRIGTPVFLRNSASQAADRIGTIVNVIPSDSALVDFALYDVDFASGLHTLHGSALEPVPIGIPSCDEKQHLLVAHKKAFDIYMGGVRELANAAGVMAHTEYEFLHSRVRVARQFLLEARQQLTERCARLLMAPSGRGVLERLLLNQPDLP